MKPEKLHSSSKKSFKFDILHSSPKNQASMKDMPWNISPIQKVLYSDPKESSASVKAEKTFSKKALVCLAIWYIFSFATLFLNKYILSYHHGDPTILGSSQLLICSIIGYFQLRHTCGLFLNIKSDRARQFFLRNMSLVGTLRFSTLIMGLIALSYVPVSFAETVKSSAPVFTVMLAWLLMSEKTSLMVFCSLIPVMLGLALCSVNELSFNVYGFLAAMSTNLCECFQNVYSKKLLSGEEHSYTPLELQFYTSSASVLIQIPTLVLINELGFLTVPNTLTMAALLLINGIFFHCQSITEYTLLGCISPVTHSVANTVKRALMIWLSILIFKNDVTFLSGLGTSVVIFGVFVYIKARQYSSAVHPVRQVKCVKRSSVNRI